MRDSRNASVNFSTSNVAPPTKPDRSLNFCSTSLNCALIFSASSCRSISCLSSSCALFAVSINLVCAASLSRRLVSASANDSSALCASALAVIILSRRLSCSSLCCSRPCLKAFKLLKSSPSSSTLRPRSSFFFSGSNSFMLFSQSARLLSFSIIFCFNSSKIFSSIYIYPFLKIPKNFIYYIAI